MEENDQVALVAMLGAVLSRQACADLVHEYARCIRGGRPQDVAALFAPDGTFELREGHPDNEEHSVRFRLEGRDQVNASMSNSKGPVHPIPQIHNLMIDVEGETASGNCVMEAQIYRGTGGVFGEYHDSFRRIDGRWYFASRIYTIFSSVSSA